MQLDQLSFLGPPDTEEFPPVDHYPDFLTKEQADYLYDHCAALHWQQNSLRGSPLPRMECAFSDLSCGYTYLGITLHPKPLTKVLKRILAKVNDATGNDFQMIVGNWYLSGSHHIGWHSDGDGIMGPDPAIATLSLGATRVFRMRKGAEGRIYDSFLEHGSLLIMRAGMQREWLHQILKNSSIKDDRISLTFRPVLVPPAPAPPKPTFLSPSNDPIVQAALDRAPTARHKDSGDTGKVIYLAKSDRPWRVQLGHGHWEPWKDEFWEIVPEENARG
jgi:alkylated DNA repair dioxygenase AlkB